MSLVISGLSSGYRNIQVLDKIDLTAREHLITGIIGPNGAGKSTLLKTVFGYLPAWQGQVTYKGVEITNLKPRGILKMSVSYVAQSEGLFPRMTVKENLVLGGYLINDKMVLNERIEDVLRLSDFKDRRHQLAGSLSGGEQRILEIGRGMMLDPTLVLLDEPSAALAPKTAAFIYNHIHRLNEDRGVTFLIVEQDVNRILEEAHHIYALELGKNRYDGKPAEFKEEEHLRRLFLGS